MFAWRSERAFVFRGRGLRQGDAGACFRRAAQSFLLKSRQPVSAKESNFVKSWRPLLFVAVSLLIGFAAGFLLANGLNRQEQDELRSEVARLRAGAGDGAEASASPREADPADELTMPDLTDEQLRSAVAQADASPRDAELQSKSGRAIYLYAMQKGNASVLPDVARILARAFELDRRNSQLAVFAGNAHFLLARNGGGRAHLRDARLFYEKALAVRADDADARTGLGLTYFFDEPSDPRRAAAEYRRALEADPRGEPPLQSLAAALIATGELAEAESRLAELASVNPNNPQLPGLRAQLEQKRNADNADKETR